ncbi:MAG: hypothetical protein C7B46_11445 [Sulfobacillus benefaciens]|uniref:GP-PDE domain-containing protein n=1 Tax=Sulfobacillus benefaciens TaxID=453960 RepID=A0A2T2XF29_9FIRM|nr:MAG: hypothetical protein C7B46_11445 [Sulfobacillus benefaciens]
MGSHHKPWIWGHRGASALEPENTIPSFLRAYEQHVDGIELDVQLSADGVVVVMHDGTLDRTTNGTGWVGAYNWSTLRQLRTRHLSGPISDVPIPRLEEVFEALPSDTVLCIEYKNGPYYYPRLVEKTLEIVHRYQANSRIIVSSFDQFALVESASVAPEIPRAVAWMGRMVEPWGVARAAKASWVHVHKDSVPLDDLRRIKESGLQVAVWGLKSSEDASHLATQYVDAVFVDDPGWAVHFEHR